MIYRFLGTGSDWFLLGRFQSHGITLRFYDTFFGLKLTFLSPYFPFPILRLISYHMSFLVFSSHFLRDRLDHMIIDGPDGFPRFRSHVTQSFTPLNFRLSIRCLNSRSHVTADVLSLSIGCLKSISHVRRCLKDLVA
jgi:hypothetical protein